MGKEQEQGREQGREGKAAPSAPSLPSRLLWAGADGSMGVVPPRCGDKPGSPLGGPDCSQEGWGRWRELGWPSLNGEGSWAAAAPSSCSPWCPCLATQKGQVPAGVGKGVVLALQNPQSEHPKPLPNLWMGRGFGNKSKSSPSLPHPPQLQGSPWHQVLSQDKGSDEGDHRPRVHAHPQHTLGCSEIVYLNPQKGMDTVWGKKKANKTSLKKTHQ